MLPKKMDVIGVFLVRLCALASNRHFSFTSCETLQLNSYFIDFFALKPQILVVSKITSKDIEFIDNWSLSQTLAMVFLTYGIHYPILLLMIVVVQTWLLTMQALITKKHHTSTRYNVVLLKNHMLQVTLVNCKNLSNWSKLQSMDHAQNQKMKTHGTIFGQHSCLLFSRRN